MQRNFSIYFNRKSSVFRRALGSATALATVLALNSAACAQEADGSVQGSVTALRPITVSSGQAGDEKTDSETVAAKSSSGASKIRTPLIETPRSVSVVTRKELDQRGAQDIIEAVRYSAGVTTGAYGFDPRFDQIFIRGYDATTIGDYKDGLRQPFINYGTFRTEPYALERVEVIKGPVSVLYGAGSPAGIINKTSKLPTEETIREVGALYGTEDRAQAMFDFGGQVSEENDQVLYRLVGLARNGETNFDIADDRYLIQPALTWKPDDYTSFTIYGLAQADETDANVGAVVDPLGKVHDLRASDPDYDYQKVRQQQIGYQFEHEFDGGITFRQNLRYSHMDLRARYLGIYSWTDTVAHRGGTAIRDEMNVFQVDNQLEAKFDTGPAAHTMLLGVDYTNLNSSFGYGFDFAADPAYDFDIADPAYGVSGLTPDYNWWQDEADLRQLGIYALDQIELDRWRFTIGGRHTWTEQDRARQFVTLGTNSYERKEDEAFSWQTGALYLFDNGIAPFASYATSFEPVTQRSESGEVLDSKKGEQIELGVKYQPPGTDILLSAVAYRIVETNRPVLVDPLTLAYRSLGEATSRGLELEARAAVTDQLDLIAAYTYNHTEITGGTDLGNTPAVTPEHVATLWANYTFAEDTAASGLSLGAGLRYVGETYKDTANTGKNDEAFYLDAAATYDFGAVDKKYEGLTAQVNVRNIGNEKPVICNEGFCYLSQGRNVTASLKYRW